MKVAFASSDGIIINRHFGLAETFHLWEIGVESAHYVGVVPTGAADDDREDKIVARAAALQECTIVYSMQIGGPAAAKLVARHVHPMKTGKELPIRQAISDLRRVLSSRPPPWLRKALGELPLAAKDIPLDE
jgi:nitrogen fixation protein NifX